VLARKLKREQMGPFEMPVFPYTQPGVGGCVTHGQGYAPGTGGDIVYLNAGPELDPALARVGAAEDRLRCPRPRSRTAWSSSRT